MKKSEVQRLSHAPERIFLQIGDDDEPLDSLSEIEWDRGDVTWCRDKIFNGDIEYVRIDRCKGARPCQ